MHTAVLVVVIAVVIALVAFAVWYTQKHKSERIKERFGPEYERAVAETGSRREAERLLEKRQERVKHFEIRPLTPSDRDRFTEMWRDIQAQFVDDPKAAVSRADQAVADVMRLRGYPIADFEQRAQDLSVDHPVVVENYRAGHEIALRHQRGQASTEDLRQAMVYYRTLFEELLGTRELVHTEAKR